MEDRNLLTASEAAKLLGISTATVYNWVRHGYLHRIDGGFSHIDVTNLQKKIRRGDISRLNRRANKRETSGTISSDPRYSEICETVLDLNLTPEESMWLTAVCLFRRHGLTADKPIIELAQLNQNDYKSSAVFRLLNNRFNEISASGSSPDFGGSSKTIEDLQLPMDKPSENDIAGIIYQAICKRGKRSASGSFYTPASMSEELISSALDRVAKDVSDASFIDPCCGSGQFILSFIKAGGKARNATGIDSDPNAAFTASVNILLQCPELEGDPRIITADTLTSAFPKSSIESGLFDLTVTNPPWGAVTTELRPVLTKRFPDVTSGESFSYFINLCIELVKPGGAVSLVLPESVTNVTRHADIRKYILEHSSICRITEHGAAFRKVFTPVITMGLIKNNVDSAPAPVQMEEDNFLINPDFTISININSNDSAIIDRLYSIPHTTLKDNASWALGIVTGDNGRYISDEAKSGYEPVIRGCDIQQGFVETPGRYLFFQPEIFQQCAPEWKYRTHEKLVYRFISKRPVFAVDTGQRLTLNSANILIPDDELIETGWNPANIARLFNSDIYGFIYLKRFNSVKVLRSHLEQLPLPELSTGVFDIDSLGLTPSQLDHIRNTMS